MGDVDSIKVYGNNARCFSFSISFMVIASRSCLCVRIFLLYGNQPYSEMDFLLGSTSTNDFTLAVLIIGMISVGIYYMSPIICSI